MREYRSKDIGVYWENEKCTHAGFCVRTLPGCFCVNKRPWIDINAVTPEEIIAAIDKCPSGALRYSLPEGSRVDPSLAHGPGSAKNADLE